MEQKNNGMFIKRNLTHKTATTLSLLYHFLTKALEAYFFLFLFKVLLLFKPQLEESLRLITVFFISDSQNKYMKLTRQIQTYHNFIKKHQKRYIEDQKMSRLSKNTYHLDRQKKQLKLWHDSPCSLSFSSKLPYIQQAGRFQHNSIYDRDDPFKPARKVDQFQKPDLLLLEFRRSIREAQKKGGYYQGVGSKKKSVDKSENTVQASSKQKEIVDRLCPKNPPRLKLEYDLYGNRSSFYATEAQRKSLKKIKKSQLIVRRSDTVFTQSQRIDMSKPQNFNPGPGTYFQPSPYLIKNSRQSTQLKKPQYRTLDPQKSYSSEIGNQGKDRPVLVSKTIVN